jgi:flavin prenyltransferase
MSNKRKLIVAVTGASGAMYTGLLLNELYRTSIRFEEVAVVFSPNGADVWKYETGKIFEPVSPFKLYNNKDFFAPFASGSSTFDTMFICPCSMGTLGRIAGGISDDLIVRAADVMLKEHRKLILVPREMPYNLIHVENMRTVMLAGGIICPASPSFYSKPETLEEAAKTVIHRILNLAGIENDAYKWSEK